MPDLFNYTCRDCDEGFDHPTKGFLSVYSPCCKHHFYTRESKDNKRPCATQCCTEKSLEQYDCDNYGYTKIKEE